MVCSAVLMVMVAVIEKYITRYEDAANRNIAANFGNSAITLTSAPTAGKRLVFEIWNTEKNANATSIEDRFARYVTGEFDVDHYPRRHSKR